MKKNLLYVLPCCLFLLTTACSAPSPASLREAEDKVVLLPPESSLTESISEELTSEPPSTLESQPPQTYDDPEMHAFLEKAVNGEPASITLTAFPENYGDSLPTDIVYDGNIFTLTEHHGERTEKWYYTDLEFVSSPPTVSYWLTGLETFEAEVYSSPKPGSLLLTKITVEGPAPEEYSWDTSIANGDYINVHGEIHNSEMMDNFLAHVAAQEPAEIHTVRFTEEGDPILTDVSYDGTSFTVTEDDSRDAFGGGIYINHYQRLEVVYIPGSDITEYRLTDRTEGLQTRLMNYVVLKYDLGDTTDRDTTP